MNADLREKTALICRGMRFPHAPETLGGGVLRAAILELHPQWIGPEGVNAVFRAFMEAALAYYPRFSTHKVVCFRRAWHVT